VKLPNLDFIKIGCSGNFIGTFLCCAFSLMLVFVGNDPSFAGGGVELQRAPKVLNHC